ncbi:MAG: putative membrane protein [Vicingaceae bacterium]|jgi:hypothetical protein
MKLNEALKPTISKLLLVILFSIIISLMGIATGSGFVDSWFLKGLLIMMPIGYLFALIFLPLSQTTISKIK